MNKTIAIIGGDYRIIILSQMLKKDGFNIKTYGLEKSNHIQENEKFDNIEECVSGSEIIVSGIPFSKDGKLVYMPFSDKKLEIEEFFLKINGKTLIAGNINKDILNNVGVGVLDDPQKNYIYDLMQNEPLTIANAISTAEGAIQIAMEETKTTIHNSNILILGFGRIGKVLAKDLQGLGAKVTCEARKDSDLTWIEAYGYKSLDIKELDKYIDKFDIIFNTIPYMILDKELLKKINKNVLIIDLASKPGGVDFEECDKMGIKYNWALALPGKVAPVTSAEWIKKCIYKILNI